MAAGESSRLNSPKQLLNWQGDYLINHVIQVVSASNIDDITVILGSYIDKIQPIINNPEINIIENPYWKSGLSSSIKSGIGSLAHDIEGAFIILLDQPFITSRLLNNMIELFHQSGAKIIAPRVGEQQGNPVLFRKDIFPELLKITGDKGAKEILRKYDMEWLNWHDRNLLLDIDSEEDYQKALEKLNK